MLMNLGFAAGEGEAPPPAATPAGSRGAFLVIGTGLLRVLALLAVR